MVYRHASTWQIRLLLLGAVLLSLLWGAPRPALANGVPVQVFLDFLPFKANWEPASHARGVAVLAANDEQVRVMAQTLPAPPPDQVYYAWLQKVDGSYMPVGSLVYHTDGTASLDQHVENLPYSENFSWVLITLEAPDRIGPEPSQEIALAGRLPNVQALPVGSEEAPALLPVTGAEVGLSPLSLGGVLFVLAVGALLAWRWIGTPGRQGRFQDVPLKTRSRRDDR
ncbi:MAG: anti-sigma factor [Caldilineae bacterium]|nr:MAG: anti-sigma factor [Caldilineae bacterium]